MEMSLGFVHINDESSVGSNLGTTSDEEDEGSSTLDFPHAAGSFRRQRPPLGKYL